MRSSKGYALLFLLVAFVAGAAVGVTLDRILERPARGSGDFRERMAEELSLTPSQKKSIDSLLTERHRQIVALFAPVKPQLDSINKAARSVSDSTHEEIKRLLNPGQQQKLESMRAAARKDLERSRRRWAAPGDSR